MYRTALLGTLPLALAVVTGDCERQDTWRKLGMAALQQTPKSGETEMCRLQHSSTHPIWGFPSIPPKKKEIRRNPKKLSNIWGLWFSQQHLLADSSPSPEGRKVPLAQWARALPFLRGVREQRPVSCEFLPGMAPLTWLQVWLRKTHEWQNKMLPLS